MASFGHFSYESSAVVYAGMEAIIVPGSTKYGKSILVKLFRNYNNQLNPIFIQEANAAKRLQGKTSVIKVLGSASNSSIAAIAMAKYDCDLFKYCFETNLLRKNDIITIFRRICRGVQQLHSVGVAHLDLKPENILMTISSKETYICDFGMCYITSRPISEAQRKDHCVTLGFRGTKEYLAPEIIASHSYNPFSADIYSLGCIFYVLTTGCFPSRDVHGHFTHFDGVPEEYMDLVALMVNPNPLQRPTIESLLCHPLLAKQSPLEPLKQIVKDCVQ